MTTDAQSNEPIETDPLDDVLFPDEIATIEDQQQEQQNTDQPENCIGREMFFQTFRMVVGSPNIALAMKGEPPLTSLQIDDRNEQARAASDELYDWASEENSPLRWLIETESTWMKRAVVLGGFAFSVGQGVKQEVAMRRAEAAQQAEEGEVSGDE